jgi:hypothetical protein
MSISRRTLAVPAAFAVLALAGLLLFQSHAQASRHFNYRHLNKIQRRIISGFLAQALAPATAHGTSNRMPTEGGPGVDEGLNVAPRSLHPAGPSSGLINYFPDANGKCGAVLGSNVKINQNCLNITDPKLQGRGQANNETSIAVNPANPNLIVASDNNYIGGDGTCGAHFSLDGGKTWSDSRIPNVFSYGFAGNARQYWQAGGDTSVAWDTRGNAYESCQVFNRGLAASANPDQSSGFLVFRSTQNHGASWNFPGRYVTAFFDPTGTGNTLEDKQLLTVDDNVSSPFRDRVYVTWTLFAADGTAYIYEAYSSDYGETFSNPVVVSGNNTTLCTQTYGVPTPQGNCNENQFSDPFVGPDGALYVVWNNFNNTEGSSTDNRYQVLLAKSTDGGQTFSAPVKVSDYYDLPDCDTYQGAGADSFRSCVPEKGSSTKSVFRATNYPSGAVDPRDASKVVVTLGSYINSDSNESNGCVPAGFASDGNPMYTGVKTPGACANKILVSVSTDGGATFTGTTTDPRQETVVNQDAAQKHTDQWWQWAAINKGGRLAVSYYDRQYGRDEFDGASDFSLSGSSDLVNFATTRVTTSSSPAPTQFMGPNGGLFWGDYTGLSVNGDTAYPIWSDTRSRDLFLCNAPSAGNPPALCTATEPNGQGANDEEIFTASVPIP